MFTVAPYIEGHPTFEIDTDTTARVVMVNPDGERVTLFECGPFRWGATYTERDAARAVVDFAQAYVERPEEFDRSADDIEQAHRAEWLRHGDAIACALSDDDE